MNTQTIGQRDLEFYEACVENHTRDLRNCSVECEPMHRERLRLAKFVVNALTVYGNATGALS